MTEEYGKGKWWATLIQSYSVMKAALKGTSTEQNHLVHQAFFKNGPPEWRHLVGEVPCLTLTFQEHRGKNTSYHNLKDGGTVGQGKGAFVGCGMDGYLVSRGIRVRDRHFSKQDILDAIDASADYWKMIGMDHCAEAVEEFRTRYFGSGRRG